VVLFWGLYPINWGIIQVGNMLKWCISYSHLYFCLIRCANDVNINNRHICGQGGSIGRLRHLKHHDAPKTMAVHHTRHTWCWWVDLSAEWAAADTANVAKYWGLGSRRAL
jgi:hypothetical protein